VTKYHAKTSVDIREVGMWRVEAWDPATRTGRIKGPHLELAVSGAELDVEDLVVGEEVAVELDPQAKELRVLRAWPLNARQPKHTERAEFTALNSTRPWDFEVTAKAGTLTIIAGNDLSYSHQFEVVFDDVSWYSGALSFSHALFRAASEEEAQRLPREVHPAGLVFCIVTEHGNGPDGAKYFVVASRAEVRCGTVYHYAHEESDR
jgi:hypothetical protein